MSEHWVPEWRGVKTFHPRLTLTVSGLAADEVLDVLLACLRQERYRTLARSQDGAEVATFDRLGLLSLTSWERTRITLRVSATAAGTSVVLDASMHGRGGPSRRASTALTQGVRELRRHGADVTVGRWEVPPERRKGKRR